MSEVEEDAVLSDVDWQEETYQDGVEEDEKVKLWPKSTKTSNLSIPTITVTVPVPPCLWTVTLGHTDHLKAVRVKIKSTHLQTWLPSQIERWSLID